MKHFYSKLKCFLVALIALAGTGAWADTYTVKSELEAATELLGNEIIVAGLLIENATYEDGKTELNAALVEGASIENPVAAPFVVNGTFDSNTNGWYQTGDFQNKGTATNQTGAFTGQFWENWNPSAKVNKMYQVIENIPNGIYKLNIAAFVNTLASPNESQYVYANNDKVYLTTGAPTMYEVFTIVENNTLEVGLEQTTATANWMGIDNISLTYFGTEGTIEQAKNAGFLKEVKDALAAKQSVKTKTALQGAYDAFVAESTDENKTTLETALAAANVSINSYAVLETGSLPDNSLGGWTCTTYVDGQDVRFQVNTWSTEGNSDGTGMVTPFIENWTPGNVILGVGEIYYSLPGLDPGIYQFSALIRAYSEAGNAPTGASLFAGEREKEFATGKSVEFNSGALKGIYDTYAMAAEVGEDGIFRFGIKVKEDRNFNWMAFKSCRVAYAGAAIDAAAVEELAATMPEGKMNADAKAAAEAAIATLQGDINLDNYEAAAKAIAAAQSSVTAYADAATAIAAAKAIMDGTNVATAEAAATFAAAIEAIETTYNDGSLADADATSVGATLGTVVTGWRGGANGAAVKFLESAYNLNGFDAALYVNTWSVEGESDGSGFKVPFYEYFTDNGNVLGANTFTTTVSGLEPGVYSATALIRVALQNDAVGTPAGVTLNANDGEAVAVDAEATAYGTLYLKEVTAEGIVGEDGVLAINIAVAAENNIHWLSFKNVKFEKTADVPAAPEIANASFEADGEKATSNGALEMTGWTFAGVGTQFNNTELRPAASVSTTSQFGTSDPSDGEYSLFFRQGWNGAGNVITVTSDAVDEIPAGDYILSIDYKQHYSYDNDNQKNDNTKVSIALMNGETTLGSATSPAAAGVKGASGDATYFNDAEWSTLTASFTLNEAVAAGAKVVITLHSAGARRSDFFLDNVRFTLVPGIDVAKAELQKAIEAAQAEAEKYTVGDGLFMYPESEIAPLTAAIATATEALNDAEATKESVNAAAEALNAFVEAFAPVIKAPAAGKHYVIKNKTADGNLSINETNVTIETNATVYFTAVEGGYVLSNTEGKYIFKTTENNWTLATTENIAEAYVINVNPVDGGYTIQGAKGLMGTDYATAGSAVYANKAASNNGIWTIEEVIPVGITGIDAAAEQAAIYDLTGRKVERIVKGGIYIINGKKVAIK